MGGDRLNNAQLWEEYSLEKQTYVQLAKRHNCSIRTIQRRLNIYKLPEKTITTVSKDVVVLMDTTYWGRNFGVMLFKDSYTNKNLLKFYVKQENNDMYIKGIEMLKEQGYNILAVVCDGRRGLFNAFENIPVQMCQFHQCAIIRRYITKKPKLPAGQELKEIVSLLTKTDKESFTGALSLWFNKWEYFLKERTTDEQTGKTFYTHKKLRSAYNSLKTNMIYLFTWYDHIELNIPNTTNAIDGHFSDLKNKLRNHNGLSIAHKKKFIDGFFEV